MDRIESYLDSVRKSLDVRTDAERDAIIAEIRDHVLESAARFESEGLDHEAAVNRAIQQAGDNRAVAASISEVHDGASWRQAWLAVLPVGIVLAFSLLGGYLGWFSPRARVLALPELAVLLTAYAALSRRHVGRIWRVTWLAAIAYCGMAVLTTVLLLAFLPENGRQAFLLGAGSWYPMAHKWSIFVQLGLEVLILAGLLVRQRKWFWAAAFLAVFAWIPPTRVLTVPSNTTWLAIYMVYSVLAWPTVAYLLFVKEWRGDWVMAWMFLFTFDALPTSSYPFGAIAAVMIACIVAAAIVAPRRFALPVFLAGVLLYGLHLAPGSSEWVRFFAGYIMYAIIGIVKLLLFWGVVSLLQRRQLAAVEPPPGSMPASE
ncbi:MAG: hypothetical protein Q7T82_08930 [Armatimonadota bacterium]|nr:hypothetical protein [Armatimonadota bacterium]